MWAANALAANMALYQPAPFDAERDLVPVSLIGRVAVVTGRRTWRWSFFKRAAGISLLHIP